MMHPSYVNTSCDSMFGCSECFHMCAPPISMEFATLMVTSPTPNVKENLWIKRLSEMSMLLFLRSKLDPEIQMMVT